MKFSPLSFCATLLLHVALFLGAMVSFHHRDSRATSKQYIRVVLPITAPTRPDVTLPDLSDNVITPGELTSTLDQDQPVDPDHYYLPAELSQQVAVIKSDAVNEVIPIERIVILAIYINEAGLVDKVELEEKGNLSEENQQKLISAFKEIVFLPGMRGTKVVKSLYRIQLKINRRLVIHY